MRGDNFPLAVAYYMEKHLRTLGLRQCTSCFTIQWRNDFWYTKGKPCSFCKSCAGARQRKWRETYKDTNVQGQRDRSKRWRESHPELFKARIKAWQIRNPESGNEAARRRRKCRKYRVYKRDYKRLRQRQQGLCYICGTALGPKPHVDHVFPIKRGGYHGIGNLLIACRPCNRSKGTKFLVEVRYRDRNGKIAIY